MPFSKMVVQLDGKSDEEVEVLWLFSERQSIEVLTTQALAKKNPGEQAAGAQWRCPCRRTAEYRLDIRLQFVKGEETKMSAPAPQLRRRIESVAALKKEATALAQVTFEWLWVTGVRVLDTLQVILGKGKNSNVRCNPKSASVQSRSKHQHS